MMVWRIGVVFASVALVAPTIAKSDTQGLAEQAQNPIADLISLPFQNNTNFGAGPSGNDQNILNIQPVVPFELNETWILVTRSILPVVYQPPLFRGDRTDLGLGDFNPSFFFATTAGSSVTWGVGPTFLLPTATDKRLGTEKWSAGPTGVIVVTEGKWVYGALASNLWSFAGKESRRNVNQFLLQYFVNYNMAGGWYLVSAPIITAD